MGLFDFLKKKSTKFVAEITTHEYTPEELDQQREQKVNKICELARTSIPSQHGLRPHEIAVLSAARNYKTSGNNFPRYWHFDYGIDDPQQILDMLFERGFIRSASAKESVEKLKVPELKGILLEFGITAKGKKADLVAAVRENISEEDLAVKIPVRQYALTQLGEQELKENEYVTYFGSSIKYGLTVWDMNKMIQGYPYKLYRDKIWGFLNSQVYEAMNSLSKSGDIYSFYLREISLRYEMCDFLIEENKHPEAAFRLWAMAFYYDLMVKTVAKFRMMLDLEKYETEPTMKRVRDQLSGKTALVEDSSQPQFKKELNLSFKVKHARILQERLEYSNDQLFQSLISHFSKCQPVRYDSRPKYYGVAIDV